MFDTDIIKIPLVDPSRDQLAALMGMCNEYCRVANNLLSDATLLEAVKHTGRKLKLTSKDVEGELSGKMKNALLGHVNNLFLAAVRDHKKPQQRLNPQLRLDAQTYKIINGSVVFYTPPAFKAKSVRNRDRQRIRLEMILTQEQIENFEASYIGTIEIESYKGQWNVVFFNVKPKDEEDIVKNTKNSPWRKKEGF